MRNCPDLLPETDTACQHDKNRRTLHHKEAANQLATTLLHPLYRITIGLTQKASITPLATPKTNFWLVTPKKDGPVIEDALDHNHCPPTPERG